MALAVPVRVGFSRWCWKECCSHHFHAHSPVGMHGHASKWGDRTPPFPTGCVLKKTQSENIAKPSIQLSLFACSPYALSD